MTKIRQSIFKEPPKPEAKATGPDPLETLDPNDDSPDYCVPFMGKRFGLNVWISGALTLDEAQAIQKAQNLIIECIQDSKTAAPILQRNGLESKGVAGFTVFKHSDGVRVLAIRGSTTVETWDTLGRAFRAIPALDRLAEARKINSIIR